MAVTIELQNLGDAQISKEISARIEHALSEKAGDWRVFISGSRESENWELRMEGPNGFERSYILGRSSGEHEPEAIGKLVVKLLLPPGTQD
jgi:hypothetical protein